MRRTTANATPTAPRLRRGLAALGLMLVALLALATTACNKTDPQTKARMKAAGELIEQAKADLKNVENAFNDDDFRKASETMDAVLEETVELGMALDELSALGQTGDAAPKASSRSEKTSNPYAEMSREMERAEAEMNKRMEQAERELMGSYPE